MSTASSGSKPSSVKLVPSPSLSASADGGRRQPVSFPVPGEGGGGVSLVAVGRAVGMEPSTVRLNGHYLSRGPDLVSSVSWGSLLSFFTARGFPDGSSDHNPIVVQGRPVATPGFHCPSDGEDGCRLACKRKVRFEDESPLKKNRISKCNSDTVAVRDMQASDANILCIKRNLNMEDSYPSKKHKITECNRVVRKNEFTDNRTNRTSVKLVLCPSLSTTSSGEEPVYFPVACEGRGGVDLCAIGRTLGLDPSSVRLNGHFLSRGPELVSSVTWDSIFSFFSARGFPTGDSDSNSIVVQGKSLLTSGLHGNHRFLERKVGVEDSSMKKNRVTKCNSRDDSLCIKRRSSSEDDNNFKKPKTSESSPGNGFTCSCFNGHGKRFRENEMVPSIPCKRFR